MKATRPILLFLLLIISPLFSKAQYVTLPDSNFVNWLNANGYAGCLNGNQLDTTCNAVVNAGVMVCDHANIHDLTGITYFDNLFSLHCQNNYLDTIPQLPSNLSDFTCDSNFFSVLPLLPSKLNGLKCSYNNLSTLPVLNASLRFLDCSYNKIDTIVSLPDSLITLVCHHNKLKHLPALPANLGLLYCQNNELIDLPLLPDGLGLLWCGMNDISVLPVLPSDLIYLDCQRNNISVIPSLPQNLYTLQCDHNNILSLPTLPSGLVNLLSGSNNITTIPPLPASLEWLEVSHNQIDSLPTLPGGLHSMHVNYNPLGSLPALPSGLIIFDCDSTQLNSLPALPNTLKTFYCGHNQLTSLPNIPPNLIGLTCQNNLISSIGSLPDSMEYLDISNNPISCLPEIHKIHRFRWFNTNINCLPNAITIYNYADPLITTAPVCNIFNTENCSFYWNISGTTYKDTSLTCNPLTIKPAIRNIKMNLYSGGNLVQQTLSDSIGRFTFDTDTGTYIYTPDTSTFYTIVCPSQGIRTSLITSTDTIDYNQDFSIHCNNGFDIGVASAVRSSGLFRPGDFATVKVACGDFSNQYGLHCASGVSGEVRIRIDGPASFAGLAGGSLIPSVNGDTLIYSIVDFGSVDFYNEFVFHLHVDTTAINIQSVCLDISVTPTSGDNDTANNYYTQCFPVVNSYDPNDKEVFPSVIGNADGGWITYTINFQNTGNAPAQHIYIIDTLDAAVMAETFQLLSYSHQPLTQVIGNIVRFSFQGINLPDSVNNEPTSHGFVQFKVRSQTDVAENTIIDNNAFIYFDFNPPVETNTVSTTVNCATTINISTTICEGETFLFNNNYLSVSGNYSETRHFVNSCDTVTNLDLTVTPTHFPSSQVICLGDSFLFNGIALTAAGIFTDTLIQAGGCDSIVILTLTTTSIDSFITASICNGDSYHFNGTDLGTAGNYIDTIHFDGYCDTVVYLDLSVTSQIINITQAGNTLSIQDPGIYQWMDCSNNTVISGQSGSQFTPSANGSYAAIVTDGNCIDTSACITVILSGIETAATDFLSIRPNPANDILYIKSREAIEELIVYDVTGQTVFRQSDIPSGTYRLPVAGFSKGSYYLEVRSQFSNVKKKFVKE